MGQVVGRKRLLHTQNCMNSQTLCTDTLLRCFPASLPGIQSTKAFWPLLCKESSWLCSMEEQATSSAWPPWGLLRLSSQSLSALLGQGRKDEPQLGCEAVGAALAFKCAQVL